MSRIYNGYTEIAKWDIKKNLLDYMAKKKVLFFDEQENGTLRSGVIAGVEERDGKVYFSMSTDPTNFRYRGGKGWYTANAVASLPPPAVRQAALRTLSDRLLEAISNDSTEDMATVLTDLAATLRVSAA